MAACKQCGQIIYWGGRQGAWIPYDNPNKTTDHRTTCTNRRTTSLPKTQQQEKKEDVFNGIFDDEKKTTEEAIPPKADAVLYGRIRSLNTRLETHTAILAELHADIQLIKHALIGKNRHEPQHTTRGNPTPVSAAAEGTGHGNGWAPLTTAIDDAPF